MKAKFPTKSARRQLKIHSDILSEEEIKQWLNNPRSEKERLSSGYCLKQHIRRKDWTGREQDHSVFIYYHKKGSYFEVYNIHVGSKDERYLEIKKKVTMKGMKKRNGSHRKRYRRR